MTEADLVFHKKKKKNKTKKQLLDAVPEPDNPPETTTTGVDSHKKHKHKKKKTKSEKDDCRPVEGQCDTRERQNKKKRKHDAENVSVTQEADNAIRQEIQEFLPHFTFSNSGEVQKVIKYDLPRFRVFKKQGE